MVTLQLHISAAGNHEYYTGDVDNWLSLIPNYNVTTLVNQRVCVLSGKSTCKGGLYMAGLEDLESRRLRYVMQCKSLMLVAFVSRSFILVGRLDTHTHSSMSKF